MDKKREFQASDFYVLDLKDLFWKLLEQWKAIAIFAIIFSLVCGFAVFASNSENESLDEDASYEAFLSSLNQEEADGVLGLYRLKKGKDEISNYINNSVLMQLDSYNVTRLALVWYIKSEEDINKQLVAAYDNDLVSFELVEQIRANWGESYTYDQVKELITVENGLSIGVEYDTKSNFVKLFTYIPDGLDSQKTKDIILSYVDKIHDKYSKVIGEHTHELVRDNIEVFSDSTLQEKQATIYTRINSYNNQIYNLASTLNENQKTAYDALLDYYNSLNTEEKNEDTTNGVSARSIILLFILAILVYVFGYILYYAFSNKVKTSASIEEKFALRNMGEWYSGIKYNNRIANMLFRDSRIYRKHHAGHLSDDMEIHKISESLLSSTNIKTGDQIVLTYNENVKPITETFIKKLVTELESRSIHCFEFKMNYKSGVTLGEQLIKEKDAVLIILESEEIKTRDVQDIYEKCIYCEADFLGTVYVD